jgi:hypothetical protein
MSKYIVVLSPDGGRGFYKYSLVEPDETVRHEWDDDYEHDESEICIEFDSREEAENYIRLQQQDIYYLCEDCIGYFVVPYRYAKYLHNEVNNHSIEIHGHGTLTECIKFIKMEEKK